MRPVTAVILGAGSRGTTYAGYAKEHPEQLQILAVAEPRTDRRNMLADDLNIPDSCRFTSWEELLEHPRMADCVFVCTLDDDHTIPAIKAMELGYHVLLEKPMSNTEEECRAIVAAANKTGRTLAVCHVLRYTPFYMTLKKLIDEGRIGEVTTINQIENVGYWHQAHSFVRGNWRTVRETSPMILQKSCHDMDIILWLMGKDCRRVQSFGSLRHFCAENAPEGAPERCLDGCPHATACPYYAPALYMDMNRTGWPVDVITTDMSAEGRRKALEDGPYGRCVYRCDNDVVDRQVVNLEFDGGAVATFTMTGLSADFCRQLKIFGTKGQIEANMGTKEIVLHCFGGEKETISLDVSMDGSGHGGGDFGIMRDFIRVLRDGGESRTGAAVSLQSHLICFAAEKSRTEHIVVELPRIIN
ncbi:MAG: Gfo/Idh/MocA family oxidoreductase [Oscillospiraceae bacterium]|nr:Gfo/Idh/MocA family oxidoreductase [Oscillospiraceae bacterium]